MEGEGIDPRGGKRERKRKLRESEGREEGGKLESGSGGEEPEVHGLMKVDDPDGNSTRVFFS